MRLIRSVFCGIALTVILGSSLAARASVYVVDSSAPGAADTNSGMEQSPFKTVQRAAEVVRPGDTVYVMAGRYDERVEIKASGAEGKPITFQAMPRRAAQVNGFDLAGSHIRVDGFEITAAKPATAVQLHGDYCEVLDNYIHDMMVGVAGTGGVLRADGKRDYSAVAHNRIAYNKVYHSEYGFMLGGNDWLVANNEVDRLWMYAPGRRFDDCDYTRFFGKGCVERNDYYHGTTQSEIKTAHVDCVQTFTDNGEIADGMLFEDCVCFDYHEGCMVDGAPHVGNVRNWTFLRDIYCPNSPTMHGGWGPDVCQTPNATVENCTVSQVAWACVGLRGKTSTNGLILNNILATGQRAVDDRMDFPAPSNPVIEYNLAYQTQALEGPTNISGKNPLFVNPKQRDFRLSKGSPAIGAGKGGVTLGALEWPNVYYVDPRHPAASDNPAWGYPAVPLATASKACRIAQPGETILLRGGVYRETLRPASDGVTIRAMQGEKVIVSGADLIEGWTRGVDGAWSASLAAAPTKLLRDGQPWHDFTYDAGAKQITVKTRGDPRLHRFETVVRQNGIDLGSRKNVKVEGITVIDTLGAATIGAR